MSEFDPNAMSDALASGAVTRGVAGFEGLNDPDETVLPSVRATPYSGPGLPPDIERVWGEGRLDGSGFPAARTARLLIDAWGEDTFRVSKIHQQAITAQEREWMLVAGADQKPVSEKKGKK